MNVQTNRNHAYAIVDIIVELMNQGYICYPEYEFPLNEWKDRTRLVVDVYAVKRQKEILVEVGLLSNTHPDRLELLKKLKPNAKVIHVTQWKNYLNNQDWGYAEFVAWKWRTYGSENPIETVGSSMPKWEESQDLKA